MEGYRGVEGNCVVWNQLGENIIPALGLLVVLSHVASLLSVLLGLHRQAQKLISGPSLSPTAIN
jgi:hypothetical protein